MGTSSRAGIREQILKAAKADPSATHEQIAQRVGCHVSTVGKYVQGRNRGRAGATHRPAAASASLRRQAQRVGAHAEEEARWRLDEATAPAVLDAVAAHPSINVRLAVVEHPEADAETLSRFVADPQSMVRSVVARHRNTSPEVLERLAVDTNPHVRAAVAANAATERPVLERLANDSHEYVVMMVTRHAPTEVLHTVKEDPHGIVQQAIDEREQRARLDELHDPDCPTEKLVEAADSGQHFELRALAAQHPNVPAETLARLAKDRSFTVRGAAVSNPACPQDAVLAAAGLKSYQLRAAAARNPNCPQATLVELAADEDSRVRAAVAHNTSCPESSWEAFSQDPDPRIRGIAVRHCPADLLHHFVGDPANPQRGLAASITAALVADRTDCPRAILEQLAQAKDYRARRAVAERPDAADLLPALAQDSDAYVRVAVAHNPNTPKELLRDLAKDPSSPVRACVAGHPKTPAAVVKALASDADERVRISADDRIRRRQRTRTSRG